MNKSLNDEMKRVFSHEIGWGFNGPMNMKMTQKQEIRKLTQNQDLHETNM